VEFYLPRFLLRVVVKQSTQIPPFPPQPFLFPGGDVFPAPISLSPFVNPDLRGLSDLPLSLLFRDFFFQLVL